MPPSLESLREIKYKALLIITHLCEAEGEDFQKALVTYNDLLDRFYEDNQDKMAPQQYRAAREDGEYFIRLVDLALAHYQEEEVDGGKRATADGV